jgi:NAD+ kinase
MKVAITVNITRTVMEPIIRDIFVFFNQNNVELVIEANFFNNVVRKKLTKRVQYFSSHRN